MKVSVIVPIYGVEKYIERCVRSLFEQTLDSVEYIFVDDCSPDASVEILERVLEEYPHRKPQVRIIRHEVNQGIAKTRQTGLSCATGEYVIHSDPDDSCRCEMLEELYDCACKENSDIVFCDFIVKSDDCEEYSKQQISVDRYDCIKLLITHKLHGAMWNKLIRRDVISSNNIQFDGGFDLWEDVAFCVKVLCHTDKISYLPKAYTYYYQHSAQITKKGASRKNIDDMISAVNHMDSYLGEQGLGTILQPTIVEEKIRCKYTTLYRVSMKDRSSYRQIFPEITDSIIKESSVPMPWYWRYAICTINKRGGLIIYEIIHFVVSKLKGQQR